MLKLRCKRTKTLYISPLNIALVLESVVAQILCYQGSAGLLSAPGHTHWIDSRQVSAGGKV